MPLGLFDLTTVTNELIDHLKGWAVPPHTTIAPGNVNPPYGFQFTGLSPDAARKVADTEDTSCLVSVYLFHVAAEKFYRNTYPLGGEAQPIPQQPLALTLFYLLTAYSKDTIDSSFTRELAAMSIVLKCFHENPIVPLAANGGEITLTLEPQTVDEIGRLWQAINTPLRLSAVYRASVVFIRAPPPPVKPVVRHPPVLLPIVDTMPDTALALPVDATGMATITNDDGVFSAGTTVRLRARPLLPAAAGPPGPGEFSLVDSEKLQLRLPLFAPAGQYLVTVKPGPPAAGTREAWLEVAAPIVDVPADDTGLATIVVDDAGFTAGATHVTVGNVALTESAAAPPPAGQFHVAGPTTLQVRIPDPVPPLGVRQQVEVQQTVPPHGPDIVFTLWLDVPPHP